MEGKPTGREIAASIERGRREYRRMCANLRGGAKLPLERIEETAQAAGRTWRDVVEDVLADPAAGDTPQPGDACEQCGQGELGIYSSRRAGGCQIQYLGCRRCGFRPPENKRVVSRTAVSPRRRASSGEGSTDQKKKPL